MVAKPPPYIVRMMQKIADEQRHAAGVPGRRRVGVEQEAQHEEDEVGRLAADVVRGRGPDETAADVEQAQQPGEARGDGRDLRQLLLVELVELQVEADQLAAEDLLQHRRGHADHADAGGHVQAQDAPQQPELRRAPGLVAGARGRCVIIALSACDGGGVQPAGFQPVGGTR